MSYTLVVVGGGGVGKSCLTVQFLHRTFDSEYNPTIEECYHKDVIVDDTKCGLDIVDTAGQEEFVALRDQYLSTGNGFLLVYDITNSASLENAKALRTRITRVRGTEKIPFVLVGNKSDMSDSRQVPMETAQKLSLAYGCPFFETSAKLGTNVDNAFLGLVREVRKKSGGGKKKGGGCLLL